MKEPQVKRCGPSFDRRWVLSGKSSLRWTGVSARGSRTILRSVTLMPGASVTTFGSRLPNLVYERSPVLLGSPERHVTMTARNRRHACLLSGSAPLRQESRRRPSRLVGSSCLEVLVVGSKLPINFLRHSVFLSDWVEEGPGYCEARQHRGQAHGYLNSRLCYVCNPTGLLLRDCVTKRRMSPSIFERK